MTPYPLILKNLGIYTNEYDPSNIDLHQYIKESKQFNTLINLLGYSIRYSESPIKDFS